MKQPNGCFNPADFAATPLRIKMLAHFKRYYNAKHLGAPVGANGDFDVGDRSDLVKEFRFLFPEINSTSKIDFDRYRDRAIRAKVATVKTTGTKEDLAQPNQYSVVRKLLEIVPESY